MAAKRRAEAENTNGEVVVQLATRIPKALQKKLKLYSVENSISISDFVSLAIEAALEGAPSKRSRKTKAEKEAA